MQTYAQLRTRLDSLGGGNPTWNNKFLFRISDEFVSGETSAVFVEIFAIGYIKDLDSLGGENPTWYDKFLFRISDEFVSGEISAVSVEIFAVDYIKDFLIGTIRIISFTGFYLHATIFNNQLFLPFLVWVIGSLSVIYNFFIL